MSGILVLFICLSITGFIMVETTSCPKDCFCREQWLWSRNVYVVTRYFRNMSMVPDLSMLSSVSLPIYLKLSYSNLTRVTKTDFPLGLNINFLTLGGNRRLILDDDALSNTRNSLIYLDLESTKIFFNNTLTFLRGLSKLETLILSYNNVYNYQFAVSEVGVSLFGGLGLSSLKKLKMSKCDMRRMAGRVFKDVETVEELDLAANIFDAVPDAIGTVSNLKILDLSNSHFEVIRSRTFIQNKQLQTLIMMQSKVKSIDASAFEGLENSLQTLDIRDSNMTEVPAAALKELSALKVLKLDGNRINSISAGSFSGSYCLDNLSLSGIIDLTFSDDMFEGQEVCIKDLVLRAMNLRTIPLQPISTLQKLHNLFLDDNQIRELHLNSLAGIKAKLLVFTRNPLRKIGKGTFDGTSRPLFLNIDYTLVNDLTFVLDYPKGTFESLDVTGLAIPCDCTTARVVQAIGKGSLSGTCGNMETGAGIGLQTDTLHQYLSRKCPGVLTTSGTSTKYRIDPTIRAVCFVVVLCYAIKYFI